MSVVFEHKNKDYKVVGTRPIRHDGVDKVTGRAVYGADIKLPGMLWGAVLRSPHAHAKIKKVDVSDAEKIPGVHAVMTAADLPQVASEVIDLGEGAANLKWESENVMASEGGKALYKGHAIAAVAASDRYLAEEALKAIKVEYEPLPAVTNVKDATAEGAPILIEELVGDDNGTELKNTNIAKRFTHEFGNLEQGFKEADHVVECEYSLQMVHQGYIEPHNGTAIWDEEGHLRVWSSTQGAFPLRSQLAGVLKMDVSRIRVTPLEIGGGFGGKIPIYLEPVAAVLSRKSGHRPVKLVMRRENVFQSSGPAPGGRVKIKLGAAKGGRLTAAEADIQLEAGAYPGSAVAAAAMCIFSPYNIPNTRIDGWDIVVNKPKSAAYRAPGSPQAAFAMETAVDQLCEETGWDPLEFRVSNASKEGTRRGDGVVFPRIGNLEVLNGAKNSPHWQSPKGEPASGRKRGRGIASGYWFNVGLKSSVIISVDKDGTVKLIEGSTDIGGTRASISMQAAEVLGIPAEDVRPTVVDTDSVGYTDVTGGSRVTYATGYAAYNAAQKVVEEMKRRVAKIWEIKEDEVSFSDGTFKNTAEPEVQMDFKELASKLDDTGGPVSSVGNVDLENAGGAFGTHIVDLDIDPDTGKTDVVRYTVVQDAGTAIHPAYVEGQMQGGAAQGIGWALNEEYFMTENGAMANASFLDYRMPTSLDLPAIETVIVEVPNPGHPFGVRGVGEVPICPPVPAVANAIHDALGIRLYETPMNPGKILKALSS